MNLVEAKDKLGKAKGRSEHVMSIFMDIRGFSAFSKENESPNIAIYVKKLFLKVLREYFPEATYAKPTGDGLLIIYPYDEDSLSEVAEKVVSGALRCVNDFPMLCVDEPMLNFSLPEKVGFGISRGLACCLYEGDTIIDYSGHILNLAARLNGLARPAGVVIDASFGKVGLSPKIFGFFDNDSVYLKGVADEDAVGILYQKDLVEIGKIHRSPTKSKIWLKEIIFFTRKDFDGEVGVWIHNFSRKIDEEKGIKITVSVPAPTKSNPKRHTFLDIDHYSYISEPSPRVEFDLGSVKNFLGGLRMKKSERIQIVVETADA